MQSWAGSIACLLGGSIAAVAVLLHFHSLGCFPAELAVTELVWKTLLVATGGAAVEALPIAEYDNLTVACSSAAIARVLFGF